MDKSDVIGNHSVVFLFSFLRIFNFLEMSWHFDESTSEFMKAEPKGHILDKGYEM
jgi:hypothetical protein